MDIVNKNTVAACVLWCLFGVVVAQHACKTYTFWIAVDGKNYNGQKVTLNYAGTEFTHATGTNPASMAVYPVNESNDGYTTAFGIAANSYDPENDSCYSFNSFTDYQIKQGSNILANLNCSLYYIGKVDGGRGNWGSFSCAFTGNKLAKGIKFTTNGRTNDQNLLVHISVPKKS